jgi:excisionase family DNA binding protein
MKAAIMADSNIQELLKTTLLSVQKTNETIVSLVAALGKTSEISAPPAPVIIQQKPHKENMTISDAADYCGYSKSYLYQLIHRGEIPFHKPMGGRIFFKRKELDDFIARGKRDAGYELQSKAAAVLNGEVKK